MTCPACTAREANPLHGLYYASCPGCNAAQSAVALPLHLSHLKRTPGHADRRAYIETVERKEGKDAADKLKAAFTSWWEDRNAVQK